MNNLRNELVKLIKERPYCTFVEIRRYIKGNGNDVLWVLPNNIVLWHEVDNGIVKELKKLINEKQIQAYPVPKLNYIIEGETLKLPVAKRITNKYTNQHWLPVGFKYIA